MSWAHSLWRFTSPTCQAGRGRYSKESPPPATHTPFQQSETSAVDFCDGLCFGGREYKKLILDSDGDHFMFSPIFNRTPVSRDIDCYSLAKISEILAGANILSTPIFVKFSAWRAGTTSQYSAGESKSKAARDNSTLGDCKWRDQHLLGEVGDHQRGLGEVSCCGLC